MGLYSFCWPAPDEADEGRAQIDESNAEMVDIYQFRHWRFLGDRRGMKVAQFGA